MVFLPVVLRMKQSKNAYLVIDDDDLEETDLNYLFSEPEGDYLLMMGQICHEDGAMHRGRLMMIIVLSDSMQPNIIAGEILHDYGSEYWDTRKE